MIDSLLKVVSNLYKDIAMEMRKEHTTGQIREYYYRKKIYRLTLKVYPAYTTDKRTNKTFASFNVQAQLYDKEKEVIKVFKIKYKNFVELADNIGVPHHEQVESYTKMIYDKFIKGIL